MALLQTGNILSALTGINTGTPTSTSANTGPKLPSLSVSGGLSTALNAVVSAVNPQSGFSGLVLPKPTQGQLIQGAVKMSSELVKNSMPTPREVEAKRTAEAEKQRADEEKKRADDERVKREKMAEDRRKAIEEERSALEREMAMAQRLQRTAQTEVHPHQRIERPDRQRQS